MRADLLAAIDGACTRFLAAVDPILKANAKDPGTGPEMDGWVSRFLEAVGNAKAKVKMGDLAAALEAGDLQAAEAAIPLDELSEELQGQWADGIAEAIASGAEAAMPELQRASAEFLARVPRRPAGGGTPSEPKGGLGFRFDLTNPRAVEWAAHRSSTLVREVDEQTREAVRGTIRRAFDEGRPPRVAAREIRGSVGLLDVHAQAVANQRARDLADGMSADKADAAAEKYAAKLLRYRSENIARTETLRSSHQGQLELWRQAREKGFLPQGIRRRWILTDDDRLCDVCAPMEDATAGLDEDFEHPDDDVDGVETPPLHPSCRCAMSLIITPVGGGQRGQDQDEDEEGE